MQYRTISGLAHDPELAAALGDMIVVWAYAETILINTTTRVLGSNLNKIQAGYYRIPTFEARVKYLNALIEHWKPEPRFDKNKIAKAVERLSKLAITRNEWVHGDWCAAEDGSHVVVFNHRVPGSSPRRTKPVKAHDVEHHVNTVRTRARELFHLIDHDSLPS
jgi:hypothetical protein